MLGLTFSSKLDWGSYIISIAKTASKKFEPWFILWSLFLLRLLCISLNLTYSHEWNAVVTSGLVPLVAFWICQISSRNRYARLLVLHFLPLLNPCLTVKMQPSKVFSIGITLVDVLQNWLNRFHFLSLREVYSFFSQTALFFSHYSQMLQGCLCQHFLSTHSQALEFAACGILSFDL